jgi:urease accessory protein
VGADLGVMERDAAKMRDGGPTLFTAIRNGVGVDAVSSLIEAAWRQSGAATR